MFELYKLVRYIASIFILLSQVFVLDKCLLRGVLLLLADDLFVFFGDFAALKLLQFALIIFARFRFILTLSIHFSLQDLSMC